MRPMRFDELIAGLDVTGASGPFNNEIKGITSDSREIRPGWAFVALRGEKVDDVAGERTAKTRPGGFHNASSPSPSASWRKT